MKTTEQIVHEMYYTEQLEQIKPGVTEYAPTIKIFANGNGQDTKHISLTRQSAQCLINWLQQNFIK